MPRRASSPILEQFPEYRTKTALKAAVRAEIAPYPYEQAFTSELVAELIVRHHYYCAPRGLRPERFRKLPRPGVRRDPAKNYDFEGWFPEIGWHRVSWVKSVDGRSWESDLTTALRAEVVEAVVARQRAYPTCERCGTAPSVDTDHVAPEFDELTKGAIDGLCEEEIRSAFAAYDWRLHEPFRLPEDHVIRERFLALHRDARLMAVCRQCHLDNASDRRSAAATTE